jgi:hypothetical protein
MSARPSLDDYIDVAERIVEFKNKYPDGSLQTISWEIRDVDGQLFVVYHAAAYRTPDDKRPGQGMAWEPFPGSTPYTRNSELMNAETAAWGRAIVAVGETSNRKLASRQEVKARQAEQGDTPQPVAAAVQQTERPANAKQRGLLNARAAEAGLCFSDFANVVLIASGQPTRTFESDGDAENWLKRALDRLPARLVDPILEEIKGVQPPAGAAP